MIKLTGKRFYEADHSPHNKAWHELHEDSRKQFNAAAKVLERELRLEEMIELLKDYKAHLEDLFDDLLEGDPPDVSSFEIILAQLRARGDGWLWDGKEEEKSE